jgi:hypothetical protein
MLQRGGAVTKQWQCLNTVHSKQAIATAKENRRTDRESGDRSVHQFRTQEDARTLLNPEKGR